MLISQTMKTQVVTIPATATVRDAVLRFVNRHVSMLPVVDKNGRPLGAILLRDLLNTVLPAFVELLDDFDYVGDFGDWEERLPDPNWLAQSVTAVMRPIETVDANCGLVRAYSMMKKLRLWDLPVVDDDGRLVGLASRVDIGRALLTNWHVELGRDATDD